MQTGGLLRKRFRTRVPRQRAQRRHPNVHGIPVVEVYAEGAFFAPRLPVTRAGEIDTRSGGREVAPTRRTVFRGRARAWRATAVGTYPGHPLELHPPG